MIAARHREIDAAADAIDAGDANRAAAILQEILLQAPDSAAAYWQIGRLFGLNERYGEAAHAFKQAARIDPGLSRAEFALGTHKIRLQDSPGSLAAAMLVDEIGRDMYGLRGMAFADGDVVLDIGAHIGGVSVVLGKLYPHIRIFAYEPAPENFDRLIGNLAANQITNVTTVRQAVGGRSGTMELMWSPQDTAGSGGCISPGTKSQLERQGWTKSVVPCVTLAEIFAAHDIGRCAWLKLDCEGSEYGIFAQPAALQKVDRVTLELHMPLSKQALGEEACRREFLALLDGCEQRPRIDIASAVWMVDT